MAFTSIRPRNKINKVNLATSDVENFEDDKRDKSEKKFRLIGPKKLGHFSTDGQNRPVMDDGQLRRYIEQPEVLNLDLTAGYPELYKSPLYNCGWLEHLLAWICENKRGSLRRTVKDADFVCWRSMLKNLAGMGDGNGTLFGALRWDKVIFVTQLDHRQLTVLRDLVDTADRYELGRQIGRSLVRQCASGYLDTYAGYRFERYVTRLADDRSPEPIDLNVNEQFFGVFRSKLCREKKTFRLVYGGEIDCVDRDNKFVELKTSMKENCSKMQKWWLQSRLAGVECIVCGKKSDPNIVCKIEKFQVNEIPTNFSFSEDTIYEKLFENLELVEQQVKRNSGKVTIFEINEGIKVKYLSDNKRLVLSDDFMQRFDF